MAKAPPFDPKVARQFLHEQVERAIASAESSFGYLAWEVKCGSTREPHPDGPWFKVTDTGERTLTLRWQEVRHGETSGT